MVQVSGKIKNYTIENGVVYFHIDFDVKHPSFYNCGVGYVIDENSTNLNEKSRVEEIRNNQTFSMSYDMFRLIQNDLFVTYYFEFDENNHTPDYVYSIIKITRFVQ